ncbi:unnamed protein product [Ilex paraguariensis]|uniref:Inhibitor I9 domain-containing protein n=1 Tax=Ilex paraguariensis TaxID=185542 RepID=A0ABC8SJ55_9AQUA
MNLHEEAIQAILGDQWPSAFATQGQWHVFMVSSVTDPNIESPSTPPIFYTFNVVFEDLAARLADEECDKLLELPGVNVVFKDTVRKQLHTPQSPQFLGLSTNHGLWPDKL